jgi:hypothetical protein
VSAELLEIVFDHDPLGARSDAISVRQDATRPAQVPEWRRELGSGQRSAACYARDEIGSGPVFIRARFRRRQPVVNRVEVRARQAGLPATPPFWPFAIGAVPLSGPAVAAWYQLAAWLWFSGVAPFPALASANPLADIEPTEIEFAPDGRSLLEPLRVTGSLLDVPVGAYAARWRWQCRARPQDEWSDIGVTNHTIYVTLASPTRPWVQVPFHPANVQLPWLDVVDIACRWASGARTPDQAAERITRAVNGLGGSLIEYDCVGFGTALLGSPHYTLVPGVFDCSAFLERLRGGIGNGRYVNCSDCAAIVATFANALGCDLWQSKMGGLLAFPLNPTRAIGSRAWLSACTVGAFATHEVAWKDGCLEDDSLYDACLEIDGDADPAREPHLPLLPANLPFGRPGAGRYRDHLVAPPGRGLCQPLPFTRQRRFVV